MFRGASLLRRPSWRMSLIILINHSFGEDAARAQAGGWESRGSSPEPGFRLDGRGGRAAEVPTLSPSCLVPEEGAGTRRGSVLEAGSGPCVSSSSRGGWGGSKAGVCSLVLARGVSEPSLSFCSRENQATVGGTKPRA